MDDSEPPDYDKWCFIIAFLELLLQVTSLR
jgi:hypothetical protein